MLGAELSDLSGISASSFFGVNDFVRLVMIRTNLRKCEPSKTSIELLTLCDCVSLSSSNLIPSSKLKSDQIIALQAGALALYVPF